MDPPRFESPKSTDRGPKSPRCRSSHSRPASLTRKRRAHFSGARLFLHYRKADYISFQVSGRTTDAAPPGGGGNLPTLAGRASASRSSTDEPEGATSSTFPIEPSAVTFTLTFAVPSSPRLRSEEHTSELQSLMRNSYAVFC